MQITLWAYMARYIHSKIWTSLFFFQYWSFLFSFFILDLYLRIHRLNLLIGSKSAKPFFFQDVLLCGPIWPGNVDFKIEAEVIS